MVRKKIIFIKIPFNTIKKMTFQNQKTNHFPIVSFPHLKKYFSKEKMD